MIISVIMPVERLGGDAERAIASVLEQQVPFRFELIVVSAEPLTLPQTGVRNVVEPNRNPATRRNRAVSVAEGEILAFIDDDARAAPGWLANAAAILDAQPDVLAVGGPDPAPDDSTPAELLSETLLATPLIGSGVAAHESRRGTFDIRAASDVALVNLFVRRGAFTGFDESIGYIGEDTALIESLMQRGRVVYSDSVRGPVPPAALALSSEDRGTAGARIARASRQSEDLDISARRRDRSHRVADRRRPVLRRHAHPRRARHAPAEVVLAVDSVRLRRAPRDLFCRHLMGSHASCIFSGFLQHFRLTERSLRGG